MKVYEVETVRKVYYFNEIEYEVSWDDHWLMAVAKDGKNFTFIPKEAIERISVYWVEGKSDEQQ